MSTSGSRAGMRYFRFLAAGSAVSAYGSYLNMVALNLFAYQITGSPLQAGLFMALRLASSVLGGSLAGHLASRLDRKALMITGDALQALALLTLVLAPSGAQASMIYGLAVLTGVCSTCTSVALRSSVPEIVGAEQRVAANALLVTCRSMAMVAGFASAGAVVSLVGYTAAFVIDAASFTLSALNLLWLPIRTRAERKPDSESDAEPDASRAAPSTSHRATLALLRLTPLLLFMISIRAVDGFGSSAHNVGLPIRSTELDPDHPAVFLSQFWATWAVGNIAMQQLVSRLSRSRGYTPSERAFAVGAMVMSAAFILAFTGLPTALAIVVILVAGMADGFTDIAYNSRLQSMPDEHRAQVFGLSATVENLGFGIGMVVSAALLERFSPLEVVGWMHGAAVLCGLALLLALIRRGTPTTPPAKQVEGAREE
ncbi:MFS transporter [Streptomyces sp. NPDC005438]|uniref:MFS transporter n=1 Tax=Streptomyces sp. NPDC005438 TaxID=3156880 RepID=UPI0033A15959